MRMSINVRASLNPKNPSKGKLDSFIETAGGENHAKFFSDRICVENTCVVAGHLLSVSPYKKVSVFRIPINTTSHLTKFEKSWLVPDVTGVVVLPTFSPGDTPGEKAGRRENFDFCFPCGYGR